MDLKIRENEDIRDWLIRLSSHFESHRSVLGDRILETIGANPDQNLTAEKAREVRLQVMNLIDRLFDAPLGETYIKFEEVDAMTDVFFPAEFNSNIDCQFCLQTKKSCVCKSLP